MKKKQFTLAEIAAQFDLKVQGDPNVAITHLAPLKIAETGSITFLDNPVYRKYLANTQASAVILTASEAATCPVSALITDNPYACYALVATLFDNRKAPAGGIHASAVVHPTAKIGKNASIAPHVVIGEHVEIGENVVIGAGVVIGDQCVIGDETVIYPNVTMYHEIIVGSRCIIHAGVVLGADGFGIAKDRGRWRRVPQLGRIVIGDDVDIGANTTIDRGAITDTIIGNGVKLDNQIQIGHNVEIGDHTAIAGCAAVAGSAKIGKHCIIGGGAGVAGHIELGDNVSLAGMSHARNSIEDPCIYACGLGAIELKQWLKTEVRLKQLNDIAQRIKLLEKQAGLL